jgi:hypothetical protein
MSQPSASSGATSAAGSAAVPEHNAAVSTRNQAACGRQGFGLGPGVTAARELAIRACVGRDQRHAGAIEVDQLRELARDRGENVVQVRILENRARDANHRQQLGVQSGGRRGVGAVGHGQ